MYMASIVTSSVYGLGYDSIHIEWLGRPLLPKIYLECTSQVAQNTSAKTTLFTIPFPKMQLILAAYWTITSFLSAIINLFLMQFIPPANANLKGFCTCGFENAGMHWQTKSPWFRKVAWALGKCLRLKKTFLSLSFYSFKVFRNWFCSSDNPLMGIFQI